jgi:hypothetical protein
MRTLRRRDVKLFFNNVNVNMDKDAILSMMIENYNKSGVEAR